MSTIDRRTLVQSIGAVCTLGAATLTITARATAQPAESPGPFQLPPLPYAPAALEPFIDATTMGLHHDKHHAAYVKNLNDALAESPQVAKRTLEELLANLGDVPEVRPDEGTQ